MREGTDDETIDFAFVPYYVSIATESLKPLSYKVDTIGSRPSLGV